MNSILNAEERSWKLENEQDNGSEDRRCKPDCRTPQKGQAHTPPQKPPRKHDELQERRQERNQSG